MTFSPANFFNSVYVASSSLSSVVRSLQGIVNLVKQSFRLWQSLSTDKRFVFLDNNEWDLREKTPVAIVLDDDEDEEEDIEDEEEVEDEYEEDINTAIDDEELEEDDDDLDDLSVLSDDDIEEEN